jgi:hypothetical protein
MSRILYHFRLVTIFCIGSLFLLSCSPDSSNPAGVDNTECPAEQWGVDTSGWYAYPHDCDPYRSGHFTIYSDGSSRDAKQQLAELAEEVINELMQDFFITSVEDELRFTDDYTYYIYAEKYNEMILAMGYRNGFYIGAIDCVTIPGYFTRNPSWYRVTVKHELTHVFQFTLTDCPSNDACPTWLGVWFREGQAVFMSGAGESARVSTLEELYQWYERENHVNPISIHRWIDFPDPDRGGEYYPMFGLAYAYLVDSQHGHGATIADMKEMFRLMAEGFSFASAFEQALGMSVPWFMENFYALMEQYLEQSFEGTSVEIPVKTKGDLSSKMELFKEIEGEYPP